MLAEAYKAVVSEVSTAYLQNKFNKASLGLADTGYNKERANRAQGKIDSRMRQDSNSIPIMWGGYYFLMQLLGFVGEDSSKIDVSLMNGENIKTGTSNSTREQLTFQFHDSSKAPALFINQRPVQFLERKAANQFLTAYSKLTQQLPEDKRPTNLPRVQSLPITNSEGSYGNNPGVRDPNKVDTYSLMNTGRSTNYGGPKKAQ